MTSTPSIFLTVGTDLPFDRLVRTVDRWAGETGRSDVFAQIGEGAWEPEHLEFAKFLEPPEFKRRFAQADVIVAHAGMGTILSALHAGKPILVMPRRASLGEQRNEHQLATSRRMKELGHIEVADDEQDLELRLREVETLAVQSSIGPYASPRLVTALRDQLNERRI